MQGAKRVPFVHQPFASSLLQLLLMTLAVDFACADLPDYSMSKQEMKVTARYYTQGGKYLGGVPRFNSKIESYECLDFNSASNNTTTSSSVNGSIGSQDANVCLQWTANEGSEDDAQLGLCTCRSLADNRYCETWTCSQVEQNNYTSDCGGRRRLGDGTGCDIEVESEHAVCGCDIEDESTDFCSEWSCETTDNDGNVEAGRYTCARESASGMFCEAWTGEIESLEEVEVASCECSETWNGDGMCSYWTCKNRELDTCSLCDLTVAVAVFGLFGMIGALFCALGIRTGSGAPVLFGIIWVCMLAPGVVIWGGQDGSMYVGIAWAVLPIIAGLFRYVVSVFTPKDSNVLPTIPSQ